MRLSNEDLLASGLISPDRRGQRTRNAMKRYLGPIILLLFLVGVGTAIYFSVRDQIVQRSIVHVRGLVSSDKEEFFRDPRVVDALRKGGFTVEFEKAGSRQIAVHPDLSQYDFAFPSGVPAAEKIRETQKSSEGFDLYYSPMVIASWQPIAQILEANGIVKNQGAYYTFDMAAYLKLVEQEIRWNELQGSASYPAGKSVLISSTDVRKSNSAAMYLALASYAQNTNNVVQTDEEVQRIQPLMNALFLRQGFTEYSTEVPFEDFLAMGMGKSPMVMIFESQFIGEATRANSAIRSDMVLMYPDPTLFSKHILVGLSDGGKQFGAFMQNDAGLQRLAIEHGLRNRDTAYFQQYKQQYNLNMIPDTLVNVIDPPSFEILEKMILAIEAQYK